MQCQASTLKFYFTILNAKSTSRPIFWFDGFCIFDLWLQSCLTVFYSESRRQQIKWAKTNTVWINLLFNYLPIPVAHNLWSIDVPMKRMWKRESILLQTHTLVRSLLNALCIAEIYGSSVYRLIRNTFRKNHMEQGIELRSTTDPPSLHVGGSKGGLRGRIN